MDSLKQGDKPKRGQFTLLCRVFLLNEFCSKTK